MSEPYDETLRLQLRRERAEQDARDARARAEEAEEMGYTHERERPVGDFPALRARPVDRCYCGRDIPAGFHFCDLCGASVSYTGKTERLEVH